MSELDTEARSAGNAAIDAWTLATLKEPDLDASSRLKQREQMLCLRRAIEGLASETPEWRWLEKGLADRIATDFVQSRGLPVVAAGCSTGGYSQGAVARQE